jgi:hypothetical protein
LFRYSAATQKPVSQTAEPAEVDFTVRVHVQTSDVLVKAPKIFWVAFLLAAFLRDSHTLSISSSDEFDTHGLETATAHLSLVRRVAWHTVSSKTRARSRVDKCKSLSLGPVGGDRNSSELPQDMVSDFSRSTRKMLDSLSNQYPWLSDDTLIEQANQTHTAASVLCMHACMHAQATSRRSPFSQLS